MTRMTNVISTVTTALFAIGFFSCSNMQENGAEAILFGASAPDPNAAYLTLSLDDASVSKTLLPDVQSAVFSNLVLKGTKQGESQKTLGSWENAAAMQSASVPLEVGIWTFNLSAISGGSSFSGTLQKEIVSGQNQLLFSLALDDIGGGPGSFSLALSFDGAANAQNVSRVVASLENMDKTIVSGYEPKNLAISNNAVTFSGSQITAGTYRAKIKFYASVNGVDTEIASWSELVQIASGFDSSASRIIESFDELYTITYELNGGSFSAGTVVPETFTRRSNVALPSLENVLRNDSDYGGTYKAIAWCADENCVAGSEITNVENIAQNITVYAKWPVLYTITYNLKGGSFASDYAPRQKIIKDDVVELPEAEKVLRNGYLLEGWYSDENYSAESKINSIKYAAQDVAVYAKWKPVVYKIIYWVGCDYFEGNYTIEDDVTLLPPSDEDIAFNAWYEDETCVGTPVDGWSAGARYCDISFYADYTMPSNIAVDKDSIARIIQKMNKSGAIIATGNFNEDDIKNVQDALWKLNEVKPDVLVSLDLSNVALAVGRYGYEYGGGRITLYQNAFYMCKSLEAVVLPSNVEMIGRGAFLGCTSLKSVNIPNTVTIIDSDAFHDCPSIESITIPNGVTKIGADAFYECSSLKNITIPDGVTEIESCAFRGCSSLESVVIPTGLKIIGYDAFHECSSLKSVTIPSGVTEIGGAAFWKCTSLETIKIPSGVTRIGGSTFGYCSALKTVNIPVGVTEIDVCAFEDCVALESITIPSKVNCIMCGAFKGCAGLKQAVFTDSTSTWYRQEQDSKFNDIGGYKYLGAMSDSSTNASRLRSYANCKLFK